MAKKKAQKTFETPQQEIDNLKRQLAGTKSTVTVLNKSILELKDKLLTQKERIEVLEVENYSLHQRLKDANRNLSKRAERKPWYKRIFNL